MTTYLFRRDNAAPCQIPILPQVYDEYIGYKTDGFFVEVGAFDGLCWSNTLPLVEAGWRGIMIEPDPISFASLQARHGGNDKLVLMNVAAGRKQCAANLYLGGSISTMHKPTLRLYQELPDFSFTGLKEERTYEVEVRTMNVILRQGNCPKNYDVLVIDVEGSELDVLKGYAISRYRPTLAIVETHARYHDERLSAKAPLIDAYFTERGYTRIYEDTINSIYHYPWITRNEN